MVEIEKVLPKGSGLLTASESEKLEYLLTEAMMEGGIEGEVLVGCGRWLTPVGYDGIVAERNCGGWCGYPRCRTQDVERIKFVAGNERWKLKFCSVGCYKKSEFFKRQLSSEALFMRRIEGPFDDIVLIEEE